MPTSTPWGLSQSSRKIAPGIMFYSTAGHGGIHLSPTRQKEMKEKFPDFITFLGDPAWWEEDCDCCVVNLAFPDCFNPEHLPRTFQYVERDEYFASCRTSPYWQELVKRFGTPKPEMEFPELSFL